MSCLARQSYTHHRKNYGPLLREVEARLRRTVIKKSNGQIFIENYLQQKPVTARTVTIVKEFLGNTVKDPVIMKTGCGIIALRAELFC
jgi:hypothetical protein